MESILARALEYTLKYWLKSFSRDQFKLQGRTVQLSNLDINGDALHASMGLPPALNVTTAKVGKLEIILPYVSNVQVEPIVVQIDRLDLVLEENPDVDSPRSSSSTQSSTSSGKGSGYGFADKIADGMTVQVQTVNLLLETRGGARGEGGAAWASPMASITMRKLLLYTTNENWQVVNLKEARDFSSNKKFIYVFKKLEWESLSIDLLPHPDMFSDANLARIQVGANQRDDDGAKRVFFGGERFLEGISGEAYITVQRTELNSPLGLEVQLHVTEAVCPALSEPEFQLELLMQSLLFSRASVSDGENAQNLSKVMIGGLFLRDTFSRPPCTLVQPSMTAVADSSLHIPDFATNFCPPIYPLGEQQWQLTVGVPLICLHSLQVKPSPLPPSFASQTVIGCQPLMIHLQEESCLRISSFLADGIVVNPGAILPDSSVNSLVFTLKELDISVPLDTSKLDNHVSGDNHIMQKSFAGARLHIEKLFFSESPSLKLKQLNLEKDPACFLLWEGQPIDASQKKWTAGASEFSLSLETTASLTGLQSSHGGSSDLWRSVELKDASIEVAMVSADGSPLTVVPPPGGVVRIGIACQQFMSNTSVEQLFFVLDLYAYIGMVSEKIAVVGKNKRPKRNMDESLGGSLMEKVPSDTAVSLAVNVLQLRFLESSSLDIQGTPLVQFIGNTLFLKVTHRTLGGAIVVSSTLCWESVQVDCVDTEGNLVHKNGMLLDTVENGSLVTGNGFSPLRAVFWVNNKQKQHSNGKASLIPFLDISIVHVIPFDERDKECHSLSVSACISGVRLGGGMNYTEALLHRFGIIGPDGGPSTELSKGLENLSSGPLSKLLKPSAFLNNDLEDGGTLGGAKNDSLLHLGMPDDVDVSIELQDWLFALEGVQEMAENWWFDKEVLSREQRCWHTTFRSLQVKAKSSPKDVPNGKGISHGMQRYPVELVTVGVEGLQTLKPQARRGTLQDVSPTNGFKEYFETLGGINLEARMVISEDNIENEAVNWVVENLKFSVKQPIEAVVTKDELQHLALLCQSEVDSMGRIAAGVLRLLKLEKSLGKETIDKLSNLGTEGFEKIFASDKLGRGSSAGSLGLSPVLKEINEDQRSTVALLEEAVLDSQVKCDALVTEFSKSESSQEHLTNIKELRNKLDSMQSLLMQLRGQM
ncbi:UHRF1-binding protein 1-like protein [Corchorus olitorius]|uniref:UHRF1-binding protein 1-like protein n=1 Tax=Corchorus olitorius TaxID=93759 RepID=A0A1R3KBN8_9ROSI|nr:UHRF1-binding protein 1-like protein [Corchorus olitorius]